MLLISNAVDFREEAFSHFINALKCDRTCAPAYTSLGIYYSEFTDPPDPTRASKCFQKAFELDPREADAAKRLAEGFADEREWDLVEVVARRTIDGEGGLEAGIQVQDGAAVARYLPTNAWAWKAVGVVELVSQNLDCMLCRLDGIRCTGIIRNCAASSGNYRSITISTS